MKALRIIEKTFCVLGVSALLFCAVCAFCGFQFCQITIGMTFIGYAVTFMFYYFLVCKNPKKIKSEAIVTFTMKDGSKVKACGNSDKNFLIDFNKVRGINVRTKVYEVDADE